jgi:hypothetical protein
VPQPPALSEGGALAAGARWNKRQTTSSAPRTGARARKRSQKRVEAEATFDHVQVDRERHVRLGIASTSPIK